MEKLTRRDMLKGMGAIGGGAAVLGAVGCHMSSADTTPATPSAPAADDWVNAGKLPDMKPGDVQKVTLPKGTSVPVIYVRQITDKDVSALTAKCTHRGCTVGYDKPSDDFICPCHGAEYDSKGAVLRGPAKNPLTALQTKFDSDKNLLVLIPAPSAAATAPTQ